MIGGVLDDKPLIIVYDSSTGTASYILYSLALGHDFAADMITTSMETLCEGGYFKNESDVLKTCIESLQEVFNSD